MPPKKKAQKANGFMVFMLDMKPRLEADGHKFPRGLLDVHPVCSPLWNNLTAEQKAVYNTRAKGSAATVKEEKLDTRGVPLAWKEREEQKKISEKTLVFQKIEHMVSYLYEKEELESHNFHLAHFNYAVATDEREYPPCEVAIVKYSLLNGIAEYYHEFIDPGKIRLGYSFEAQSHAEATHKIPATGFKLYNKNYVAITNSIKKILQQPDGGIAPLFFLDEDLPKANYILEWLLEESFRLDASYDRFNSFKTYSLNKLFYELRRHANLDDDRLKFTSTNQVADKLCSGTFEYCPNMACKWHDEEDNVKYCSLTRVRSYAYIISDLCCEEYNLSLLPSRHCPATIADEDRYVVLPKIAKREEPIPVKKQEEIEEESDEEATPRYPQTFSRTVEQTVASVGPRVAANFGSVGSGVGRGILGSGAMAPQTAPGPSRAVEPPAAGRGRGRGFLMMSDRD